MKKLFAKLWRYTLQCPKQFPAETALCVLFFIASEVIDFTYQFDRTADEMTSLLPGLTLGYTSYFVPTFVLLITLRSINFKYFYATLLLPIPLIFIDHSSIIHPSFVIVLYALSALLLVIGNRKLNNSEMGFNAFHTASIFATSIAIALTLLIAVLIILYSVEFIFSISISQHVFFAVITFTEIIICPLLFVSLKNDTPVIYILSSSIRIIINFILSPAIIIYAIILYTYIIKIAVTASLPKGGVAWLVIGFMTVALVGRFVQYTLNKHYFDFFYKYLPIIVIGPLALYWIGTIERIMRYSLTESRVYLLLAGLLMTAFSLMLLFKRTRNFQLMAVITALTLVAFTYVPGISAFNIGLQAQTARMNAAFDKLNLIDERTHKLRTNIDINAIKQNSKLRSEYADASSIIQYVQDAMRKTNFEQKYGVCEWYYTNWDNEYQLKTMYYTLDFEVELGEYTTFIPNTKYSISKDGTFVITRNGDEIFKGNVEERIANGEKDLYVYHNDSILVVIPKFSRDDYAERYYNIDNVAVFKKP